MIAVRTSSRLHFGLLGLEGTGPWPTRDGTATLPSRSFGGVGMMVQYPGLQLRVEPGPAWDAEGPGAERALAFAARYAASVRQDYPDVSVPCQRIVVERSAPEHYGLGTGTQLALAMARALALASGRDEPAVLLARRVGRGLRSALGVHGFERGGFLVEAGKGIGQDLSPLAAHVPFPDDWRVLLVLPSATAGLHGTGERDAFARLAQYPPRASQTDSLCRLALQGLLPALMEHNLPTFGEALYDFNARAGELFETVQGGVYSSAAVAEIVAFVRASGVLGVGQSSWGPAVFAVVEDEERAGDLAKRLRERFRLAVAETVVTRACNRGATVSYG